MSVCQSLSSGRWHQTWEETEHQRERHTDRQVLGSEKYSRQTLTCTDPGEALDHHPFMIIGAGGRLQDVEEDLLEKHLREKKKNSVMKLHLSKSFCNDSKGMGCHLGQTHN